MRNDSIWKEVKSVIKTKGIAVTFDVLKELLTSLATKRLLTAGVDGL